MNDTFLAVLILMVVLIGIVFLILHSLAVSAGIRIRSDMTRLLQSYDKLVEKKTEQVRRLQAEKEALEAALESQPEPAAAVPQAQETAYGTASIPPSAAYRTSVFGEGYGAIRDKFRMSEQEQDFIVEQVLRETRDEMEGRGALASRLREKLSFDTVFRLSQMSGREQLELLDTTLDDQDWTLLRDYWDGCGEDAEFSVTAFCDWLDSVAMLESDAVVVRGSGAAGEALCEGIQIVVGNRLYDYGINEREIS